MARSNSSLKSSVGKKLLTGITGIGLSIFIVVHLSGNLLLLAKDGEKFNKYAHTLHSLGKFLILAELGLIAILIVHAVIGIMIAINKRKARPHGYKVHGNAGGPSKKSFASLGMIVSGVVLLAFLFGHVRMFKFSPTDQVIYHGVEMHDLYKLVHDTFKEPGIVIGYVIVMLILGLHLWHGFWSAFQSLGLNNPKFMPIIQSVGIAFAVLMSIGFLFLPIWIYFN